MNGKQIAYIEVGLKTKPTQDNLNDRQFVELLTQLLMDVPGELTSRLFEWVVASESGEFRPTIGALHAQIQLLLGIVSPNGASVLRELRAAAVKYGPNAVPVAGRPGCFDAGPPPDLSEAARRFVDQRGGWAAFCCSEPGNTPDIFWRHAEQEAEAVVEALKIEAARRTLPALSGRAPAAIGRNEAPGEPR